MGSGGECVSGLVLSLCDYSGIMVKPWAEAGYDCMTVDLDVLPGNEAFAVKADVREFKLPPTDIHIVFAFPPCNSMAVSGSRWMKTKGLGALIEALQLVEACRVLCEDSDAPWMIENPISTLSTYWREPDFTFDPCDFGDPYTKRTCLWTGGGFKMPNCEPMPLFGDPGTRVEPTEGSKMHKLGPSPDRARLRSQTPPGFAKAVFEANA